MRLSSLLFIFRRIIRRIRGRRFPVIRTGSLAPSRPVTFVTVRFSDECEHNLLASPCVRRSLNQLVLIDNTSNVHYDNLPEAMNAGLDKAVNELVVVVHEDTYLPDGWQAQLELALEQLEQHDPEWGIIGTAGLTSDGVSVGHYSDPNNYCDTFGKGRRFTEVSSVDEHIMLFRRSSGFRADESIPGIHGIGADLVLTATKQGRRCYVVDAPSIHKYRDGSGKVIQRLMDSPKIADRLNYAYKADKACCDEYISHKWADLTPFSSIVTRYEKWRDPRELLRDVPPAILEALDSPLVLLAKGGGGSRLLSVLVQDCGVALGHDVNISGDCMDMVIAVYQGVIEKYKCRAQWQRELVVPQLRLAAARMLTKMPEEQRNSWGFKLPENLILLPELNSAFPEARYVQMFRNPVSTCLRRTHMTARLDNQIGRVTLPLAYRAAGIDAREMLEDSPAVHNAYSTLHQIETAIHFCHSHFNERRYCEVRFQNILKDPAGALASFSSWLGVTPVSNRLADEIDVKRASQPKSAYPPDIVKKVEQILNPLLKELHYDERASDCSRH